jgi:hypothetical protein
MSTVSINYNYLEDCEFERAFWLENAIFVKPSLWPKGPKLFCIITP